MSSFVIGLTGGIGSGKSTVARLFAEKNIDVIDADVIAREAVARGSEALDAIQSHFGNEVINSDGELNRKALREIVFSDPAAKEWLNNLLHPIIRHELVAQAASAKSPYCIVEIPLLVENGLQHLVNRIAVVDCDENQQINRSQERDNADKTQIKSIMQSQCNREERLKHADDVIDNSGNVAHLESQVAHLHQQYLLQTNDSQSKLAGNSV